MTDTERRYHDTTEPLDGRVRISDFWSAVEACVKSVETANRLRAVREKLLVVPAGDDTPPG